MYIVHTYTNRIKSPTSIKSLPVMQSFFPHVMFFNFPTFLSLMLSSPQPLPPILFPFILLLFYGPSLCLYFEMDCFVDVSILRKNIVTHGAFTFTLHRQTFSPPQPSSPPPLTPKNIPLVL